MASSMKNTLKCSDTLRLKLDGTVILRLCTCIFSILSIASVLFLTVVTRFDKTLLKPVGITGMNILSSIGKGKIVFSSKGTVFNIHIPAFLIAFLIVVVLLQGFAFVLSVFKKEGQKPAGILLLASAAVLIIFFLVTILFDQITAINFDGASVAFYKLFDYGLGVVLPAAFAFGGFCTGVLIKKERIPLVKRFWFMYVLLAIPMLLLVVFSLYPILLQTILSFKEYKFTEGIWGSEWVGFKHFKTIFTDPDMARIIFNTVKISLLRLAAGMLPPIILALMIFEIRNSHMKKAVQTITYIPHFFSWVIIYGIVFAFLSPNGIVNNIIVSFGDKAVNFLTSDEYFIPMLIISDIWKELGWGTILYLAALSSVDTTLFDAAAVDGAGPFRKLWNITLPSISSIIVFLFIMAIGNILKGAGAEQILLFANNAVMNKAEVIDTWVYWQGLGNYQYSLGAAVSFVQSFIGIILVLSANKLSVKLVGRGLW